MQRQCQHWRFVPGLTAYRPDPQRLPLPTRLRQDPGQEVIFQVVEPCRMSKESRLHTSIPFPPVIDQLSILHSGKQTAQLSRHASPLACQVQWRPRMRATNNTADEEQSHMRAILPRKRDDVNKQALRMIGCDQSDTYRSLFSPLRMSQAFGRATSKTFVVFTLIL